jgi:hypothetical protein
MYDFEMTTVDCIKELIVVRNIGDMLKVEDRKTLEDIDELKEIRVNLYSYHNES